MRTMNPAARRFWDLNDRMLSGELSLIERLALGVCWLVLHLGLLVLARPSR